MPQQSLAEALANFLERTHDSSLRFIGTYDFKLHKTRALNANELEPFADAIIEKMLSITALEDLYREDIQKFMHICQQQLEHYLSQFEYSLGNNGYDATRKFFVEKITTTTNDSFLSRAKSSAANIITADTIPSYKHPGITKPVEKKITLQLLDENGKIFKSTQVPAPKQTTEIADQKLTDADAILIAAYYRYKQHFITQTKENRTAAEKIAKAKAYAMLQASLTWTTNAYVEKLAHTRSAYALQFKILRALHAANLSNAEAKLWCFEQDVFADLRQDAFDREFDSLYAAATKPKQEFLKQNTSSPMPERQLSRSYWQQLAGINAIDNALSPLEYLKLILKDPDKKPASALSCCMDTHCRVFRDAAHLTHELDKKVLEWFQPQINEKPVVYISLGAGGLRRDYERLKKIKEQNPNIKLHFVAIDPNYAAYLQQQQKPASSLADAIRAGINNDRISEFSNWFASEFEGSTITIAARAEHVCKFMDRADIIIAEDIYEGSNEDNDGNRIKWYRTPGAHDDFIKLYSLLAKDPRSIGIELIRNDKLAKLSGPDLIFRQGLNHKVLSLKHGKGGLAYEMTDTAKKAWQFRAFKSELPKTAAQTGPPWSPHH